MLDPSDHTPPFVVKLVDPALWPEICHTNSVAYSALDEADGYMHLSTQAQMIETANRYYTAHQRVLGLKIETSAIKTHLKWEPAAKRNNELFPHLYGQCAKDTIAELLILAQDKTGTFSVVANLPANIAPDTDFTAIN